MGKSYVIPQQELKVSYSTDVVVCGGGTAGVFAAVAAAEQGKKVIMIEQFGSVGGSATLGLVTPLMHTHIQGDPQCSYLAERLNKKVYEYGYAEAGGRVFDPMGLKIALEEMCSEAGVQLLYHTFISDVIKEGDKIVGVIIENKAGRSVVEGKIFIDCTGDGDVSVLAGAAYTKGNPETGKNQPISLRYILGGIDIPALGAFLNEYIKKVGVSRDCSYQPPYRVYMAVTSNGEFTLSSLFDEAIANGDLIPEDKIYWQVFIVPGRNDSLSYNCPEFFDDVDGTNPEHLTKAQVLGKKAIRRQLNFYKKYMKGFENAYIADIATMVGIRESRNITTEYVLTGTDILSRRKFEDAFCQSSYPIDVHGKKLKCEMNATPVNDGKPFYEMPYKTLVVKGIDNLAVAGRCIGAEFIAQSSIRIQPSMRAAGEAAGIAAAKAIDENVLLKDIDGKTVREIMIEKGARFYEQV